MMMEAKMTKVKNSSSNERHDIVNALCSTTNLKWVTLPGCT